MREVKQEPVFEIGLLLQSASLAGINTRDIPSNANPWTWKDPRAVSWQSAVRSLSPVLAQDAEIYWGEPLSLALQAAVEGQGEWTPELDQEFAAKRPHQREERREAAVKAALDGMAANLQAEREARAARTPTPEQLQSQLIASRNSAYASLAQKHYSGEV
jgi:hypothetical protein